jgi:hypothetical protein
MRKDAHRRAMKIEEIEGIENLATKDDLRILAAELRGEIKTSTAELRTEILALKADLLKWAIGMQLSFAALILGAVYAMLSHWKS